MKQYRISSAADLWTPYIIDVSKEGYITAVSERNDIIIGAKFESMAAYWNKFEGENAYKIEEQHGE